MQLSVEDFEKHVTGQLSLFLQASLDATNAQYLAADRADGLADPDGTSWVAQQMVLPEPEAFYPGGLDTVVLYPSIEAAVPDFTLRDYSIGQQDAVGELRLIVQAHVRDARFPVLNRLNKRYSAAIYDVLKVQGALGDASIMEARFAWRTDPEAPDENDRISAGALIFLTLETAQVRV